MQHYNNKIDADLLGKLVLARCLEMPLRAFDKFVTQVESSAGFTALRAYVLATQLKAARVHAYPDKSSLPLGEIQELGGDLTFAYYRASFAREYQFNAQLLAESLSRGSLPKDQASILGKLRLINTRNRFTWALVQAMLTAQTEYLRCGDDLALVPLTQAEISARLIAAAELSMVADPGRISRLIRGLSIMLPNRQVSPLNKLFPKPQQIHCHIVSNMIEREKILIIKGVLATPLPDEAIATKLARDHGVRVSRRTVANIRRDLDIPDCRSRGQRMNYLTATMGFSALLPLTPQTLRGGVPIHSGVYEIRTSSGFDCSEGAPWEERYALPRPKVIYIGSAGDLRKRLGGHLRGNSGNTLLYRYIADGTASVRFRLIQENWRSAERDLYHVFCATFGSPPLCNRMSP